MNNKHKVQMMIFII